MVQAARKALSPEQIEEYKKIGEHMYNNTDYHLSEVKSTKVKDSSPTDLLVYAVQALKAGGDPKDLTDKEIDMLVSVYGEKWYEKFDLDESEVPKKIQNIDDAMERVKSLKISRQEKRLLMRRMEKEKNRKV